MVSEHWMPKRRGAIDAGLRAIDGFTGPLEKIEAGDLREALRLLRDLYDFHSTAHDRAQHFLDRLQGDQS